MSRIGEWKDGSQKLVHGRRLQANGKETGEVQEEEPQSQDQESQGNTQVSLSYLK